LVAAQGRDVMITLCIPEGKQELIIARVEV
jgi:hypothetical protein